MEPQRENTSYTYQQQHKVFSVGYYVRCSYDNALSAYQFRRGEDCVAWFVRQLENLAHQIKIVLSVNVPMETLSRDQWETYRSDALSHL
ncbi:hypothetical protein P5V15_011294 [Pogonomyrmex californicus]